MKTIMLLVSLLFINHGYAGELALKAEKLTDILYRNENRLNQQDSLRLKQTLERAISIASFGSTNSGHHSGRRSSAGGLCKAAIRNGGSFTVENRFNNNSTTMFISRVEKMAGHQQYRLQGTYGGSYKFQDVVIDGANISVHLLKTDGSRITMKGNGVCQRNGEIEMSLYSSYWRRSFILVAF